MFSNPLKQAAEDYLYTDDDSVRERTKQQLVRAGSSVVAPLIDALIVTLRKLNSASWGKSEMQAFTDAVAEMLGPYADRMRQEINAMPDREGDGMSMAQVVFSREAVEHTWQVISQIGESGIRALFMLINGRDKHLRLAAMLALSAEENPSRLILNLLMTSAPFLQETHSDDLIEDRMQLLILRTLGLSGDRHASEMIDQSCRALNMTESEFYEEIINEAIYLIAKSK
jgi:hypothetical protein